VRRTGTAPVLPGYRPSVILFDQQRIFLVEHAGTAPAFPPCHDGVILIYECPVKFGVSNVLLTRLVSSLRR
jgi:hypothetical protein